MTMLRFVCRLFAALPVTLATSLTVHAVGTLRVLAWPGYAGSDPVKVVAKSFEVHVEMNFVSLRGKFLAP